MYVIIPFILFCRVKILCPKEFVSLLAKSNLTFFYIEEKFYLLSSFDFGFGKFCCFDS